jgi:succinate-acetate transporter protein
LTEVSGQDFSLFYNCLWTVIVTICTVGYGEVYPKSHLGRFVGIISCLWGFFVISMMVVTMGSIVKFSLEE